MIWWHPWQAVPPNNVRNGLCAVPFMLICRFDYLSPMYMLSYAISGDAALQLYELEVQEAGAGLRCYEEILASDQVQILSLLEEAGLRSPFEPGAIEKSRDTFVQMLEK